MRYDGRSVEKGVALNHRSCFRLHPSAPPPCSRLVLSHFQVSQLLTARRNGESQALVSPDLGLSQLPVRLDPAGVVFPDERMLAWSMVEQIAGNEKNCFVVDEHGCHKLLAYSESTSRAYGLFPTRRAPALLLSGVTMHRIKGIDPVEDTERKVGTIAPVRGKVLDTCTGLGYTAIAAAQCADRVTTIELDPVVLDLAKLNPWSQELFNNPKIDQLVGDSAQLIEGMADLSVDSILHDPPMIMLAGEMFSTALYEQFLRVLRVGGRLFHYVGDPETHGGSRTTRSVTERLHRVGFRQVQPCPEAFGVVARR